MTLRIGILGSGSLGSALGRRFAEANHQVCFGVRNLSSPRAQSLANSGLRNIRVASLVEAAAFGGVLIFAIPGNAMSEVVPLVSAQLSGKTIIDASNVHCDKGTSNGISALLQCRTKSYLFRTFHYQGFEVYEQPRFGDLRPDLFFCGSSDPWAQGHIETLAAAVEMRPICLGGLEQVDDMDALARLWCTLAANNPHGQRLAFHVLQ